MDEKLNIHKGVIVHISYFWVSLRPDNVSSTKGRDSLNLTSIRLNPDLIRISYGTESLEAILGALDEALQ